MEHGAFNTLDLIVLALVFLSGLMALFRGFVREAVALGVWAGASAAAAWLYPLLKPIAHHHIKTEILADAAAGIGGFCAALLVLIPLGYLISSLVRGRALTSIDRSLGFVFGLVRGVLIVCLLFLLSLWVWPDKDKEPEMLAQARTRPLLAYGAEAIKTMLPKEKMDKTIDTMEKTGADANPIPLDQLPAIVGSKPDQPAGADSNNNNNNNLTQEIIQQLIAQPKGKQP